MLFKGLMVTALSGKLDGLIASHNRGGPYFKGYSIPLDPNTVPQQLIRAAAAAAAERWQEFTDTERNAWNIYAATKTRTNRLGDRRSCTGRTEHMAFFVPRWQAQQLYAPELILNDYPPSDPSDFKTPPTVTIDETNENLHVAWPGDQGFEENDDDGILVYAALPRGLTVNWFRGPYRLCGMVRGGSYFPGNPATVSLAALGASSDGFQKIFWRIRLSRAANWYGYPHTGYVLTNNI